MCSIIMTINYNKIGRILIRKVTTTLFIFMTDVTDNLPNTTETGELLLPARFPDTVKVRFTTDPSVTRKGFKIDRVEYYK